MKTVLSYAWMLALTFAAACSAQPQVLPDRWEDADREERMTIALVEWDHASTAARLLPPEELAQRRHHCERAAEWLAWLRENDEGMIDLLEQHQRVACGQRGPDGIP